MFSKISVLIFVAFFTNSAFSNRTCGYESCHKTKPGFVNVHIVPHTHDDVGWLKTLDQYYYGSKSNIQKAGVQYILDSVIDALKKDNNRRFIYVETAFFWKWWMKQHDFVKHSVKRLVSNGQLEFIGGAWSMNDEATTHYQSIIDQFSWGLRKLNETFGKCGTPKVGWQIDPFGHSREMASLFSQMGYDGLLLGRIDYQDKSLRFKSKTPEFLWKFSDSLDLPPLLTSVMYNTYSPPPGFCFDTLCADEPIIDDKKSPEYNVDRRVNQFLQYLKNVSSVYETNNLIITMGDDFNYQDAHMWYKNLDKLIHYANEQQKNGSKYNLLYSTPSCYLKSVRDDVVKNKISLPVKEDDFFPYASDPNAYWTGYFTSKPTLKRYERLGNNFLQVCKQLYALTDLGPEDWVDLNSMREAMGVLQHHDAITGTAKDHVAHDYARILSNGFNECDLITTTALNKLVKRKTQNVSLEPRLDIDFNSCLMANISQCNDTENQSSFIVTIYNPLSRVVTQPIRLPVTGKSYTIQNDEGKSVIGDIVPIHDSVLKIPGRRSNASYELVFPAENLPPLGFRSYYINKTSGFKVLKAHQSKSIKNEQISLSIDNSTGRIIELNMNGKSIKLNQDFSFYVGMVGNNEIFTNRSSGAYIFRPKGNSSYSINNRASIKLYQGNYVVELHQTFNEWISQVVRVYSSENHVEFDWLVGPIPSNDTGKEVVTKYTSNLKSESTFYTDSNGREMLKRVRDFRPTWLLDLHENIAGNYYPVTSKILLRDPANDVELAVLTDRAEGGSSLKDGEIELMLHRTCLHDDAFGVDEPLLEKAYGKGLVVRGTHYLVAGPYLQKNIAVYERELAQRKLLQAWTFISSTQDMSFNDYKNKYIMKWSGLKTALPENVQILTLEPWKGMGFLLRLEHIMAKNEDPVLSKKTSVNLKELFAPFNILWFKETTLGANQWMDARNETGPELKEGVTFEEIVEHAKYSRVRGKFENRWRKGYKIWKQNQFETNQLPEYEGRFKMQRSNLQDDNFTITLNPMEIKTFLIEIKEFE